MRRTLPVLLLLGLSALACATTEDPPTDAPVPPVGIPDAPPTETTAAPAPVESSAGLAAAQPSTLAAARAKTTSITSPASGVELKLYVDLPSGPGPHRAVVLVPGGVQSGRDFPNPRAIAAFVAEDIAVVRYDPDGRGDSGGEEDFGGPVHQAALREVIRYAIARDDIIDDQVGVIPYSFGITTAAGALSNDNPGARFLIDWEGPSSRGFTRKCDDDPTAREAGRGLDLAECDDEAWWASREAATAIDELEIPYQRIQFATDHVHGSDWGHAKEMIDNAVAGGVPWVRLNLFEPNARSSTISSTRFPDAGRQDRDLWMPDYAADLFMVIAGEDPPERTHVGTGSDRGKGGKGGGGGRGKRGR